MNLTTASVQKNLTTDELITAALENGEGVLSSKGALRVTTGSRTGRSPKDRFIVKDDITAEAVDWGKVNQPIEPDVFANLWEKAENYMQEQTVYVSNLQVGADEKYGIPVTVITQFAWHNIFARNLFIRTEKNNTADKSGWTILNAPGLKTSPQHDGVNSDGVVIINFSARKVLLIGMQYAGEMKKAMFTVLNFLLPVEDVLPMHCAANVGKKGDTALFFGLSGTGKTTLSADPERFLIGDDEHGWSSSEVFNFEGGCYAKCIALSQEREPVIWNAITDGAIMENVVLKGNNEPDYDDGSLTENTRAAYPREHIKLRVDSNSGDVPKAVVFLTCDLYGVLPPVALLSKEQAAYYFLSGYTALVGSTEVGSAAGISSTFSSCFGAPFFPRNPEVYAKLLMKRIEESGAQVYLVNTGWTGGAYGAGGKRFDIPTTRAVISAIVAGSLRDQPTEILPGLNLAIPQAVAGVESQLLNPKQTWQDGDGYKASANELIAKFQQNFTKFNVAEEISAAGPELI